MGVAAIRGSETDVLSRFEDAVRRFKPDAVVRICADNPLIDPGEIDKLVLFFGANDFDYAANNAPECGLPDGLGCEIVKAGALLYAASAAKEPVFREHVTNYITSRPDKFSAGLLMAEPGLRRPELKLDIDTEADLEKIRKFCASLPEENAPYWTAHEIVTNAGLVIGS
jgi:spore coat polysaccharide biosynthesis protein SpsF